MSILDMINLPQLLDECDDFIVDMESQIQLSGKPLLSVMTEHPKLVSECHIKKADIKKILKLSEAQMGQVKGRLYRQYTENMDIQLQERAKEKYIEHDPEYLEIYAITAEIAERYDKLDGLCTTLLSRGYLLKNIVEVKTNALEYVIL